MLAAMGRHRANPRGCGFIKYAQMQFIVRHHIEALSHPHQATGCAQVCLTTWVLRGVQAQGLNKNRAKCVGRHTGLQWDLWHGTACDWVNLAASLPKVTP